MDTPQSQPQQPPTRSKDPRRIKVAVESNIRQDTYGYLAAAHGGGKHRWKRFPLTVPLARIREWIHDTRLDLCAQKRLAPIHAGSLKPSLSGWCYVYFVRSGNHVKVGRAINPVDRVRRLQTSHPSKLSLIAAVPAHSSLEAAIHTRFARLRSEGEWFVLDDEFMAFIQKIRDGANPVALLW
jgi:hypothetical protein